MLAGHTHTQIWCMAPSLTAPCPQRPHSEEHRLSLPPLSGSAPLTRGSPVPSSPPSLSRAPGEGPEPKPSRGQGSASPALSLMRGALR